MKKSLNDKCVKDLDLDNVCYHLSNVEMECDEHHFEGYTPLVDCMKELKETSMYKAFMELEHKGNICITSNQIAIGNLKIMEDTMPTEDQAAVLFQYREEIEKRYPAEPLYGWSNNNYMRKYGDDIYEEDEFDEEDE